MFSNIKDKLVSSFRNFSFKDIILFLKNTDKIEDFLQNNIRYVFIFIFLLIIYLGYSFYNQYIEYKMLKINNVILKQNNNILKEIKQKREKEVEYYKQFTSLSGIKFNYNLGDVICFFDQFDDKLDYVNRKYKIKSLRYDEKKQQFDVSIQGLKHYKDLPNLLVLLKQYKTLIDLENVQIDIVEDKTGIGEITYYKVVLRGNIANNALKREELVTNKKIDKTKNVKKNN